MLDEVLSYEPTVCQKSEESFKGQYRVVRKVVKTKVYDPIKIEVLTYEYVVATIHSIYKEFLKQFPKASQQTINEINRFCGDLKEQKVYFYNRVLNKNGEELPIYEGILYLGDASPIEEVNGDNRRKFIQLVENIMKDLVFGASVGSKYSQDYFQCLHYLGDDINEYLTLMANPEKFTIKCRDSNGKSYIYTPKQYAFIKLEEEFPKHCAYIQGIEDMALRNYMTEVYKSFVEHIILNEMVGRCKNCDSFFKYHKAKKYCSTKCRKSVANRKNYRKRKKGTE